MDDMPNRVCKCGHLEDHHLLGGSCLVDVGEFDGICKCGEFQCVDGEPFEYEVAAQGYDED